MRVFALFIFSLSSAVIAAEDILVFGQVVDPAASPMLLRVCGTDKNVRLGVMASAKYDWFVRQVSEKSSSGSVLVEVRGKWNGESLEQMDILNVESGACNTAGT